MPEKSYTNIKLFEEKNLIEKINYFNLFSREVIHPKQPEGEIVLTIVKAKAVAGFGKHSANIKIELICKDQFDEQFTQVFFLKDEKNNNFGKFIYQVLGYEPEEFKLKDLEGKQIIATIAHHYNENGVGYANIAFCKPLQDENNKEDK